MSPPLTPLTSIDPESVLPRRTQQRLKLHDLGNRATIVILLTQLVDEQGRLLDEISREYDHAADLITRLSPLEKKRAVVLSRLNVFINEVLEPRAARQRAIGVPEFTKLVTDLVSAVKADLQ